jgi:hypothetical protein
VEAYNAAIKRLDELVKYAEPWALLSEQQVAVKAKYSSGNAQLAAESPGFALIRLLKRNDKKGLRLNKDSTF